MNLHALRVVQRPVARAPLRSPDLERRLARFHPDVRARVSALAKQHARLADLAWSFPALLVTLALPHRRFDPAPVIADTLAGRKLHHLAGAAAVPLWLRRLSPEALSCAIPSLPRDEAFHKRLANHLPRANRDIAKWLDTVALAAELGGGEFAIWRARRHGAVIKLRTGIRRVALWAWYSDRPDTVAHGLIEKPWNPGMEMEAATAQANLWFETIACHAYLGADGLADVWLEAGIVDDFEFVPLRTPMDICDEAKAMQNCVRTYASKLARNRARIWSVRRDGARVATLETGWCKDSPLLELAQLKGVRNQRVPTEVWVAAHRWLAGHEPRLRNHIPFGRGAPDNKYWRALWKPYWLARRRIPSWLPLRPMPYAIEAI